MDGAVSSHNLITTPSHNPRHLNMQAKVAVTTPSTPPFPKIRTKTLLPILQKQPCTNLPFKKERKTKHIRKSQFQQLKSSEVFCKTEDNQSSKAAKKFAALHSYFSKGMCQNWMSNLCVLNLNTVT
jgi:hypothetical protein